MKIVDSGDDLQRYVDILFADYRQSEPARRLRIDMLNELLLEKERLRMEGLTEKEAVAQVLKQLERSGAPDEGSLLVYADRFEADCSYSLLLWSLAALILSVPLLVLRQWLVPALLLALTLVLALRAWQHTCGAQVEDVEFRSLEQLYPPQRWLSLGWLALAGVWWVLAAVLSRQLADGLLQVDEGLWGQAQLLARYYPPLLLAAFPLWGAGREGLLLKNQVGAGGEGQEEPRSWLQKLFQ